ncbi:MAG TPA: outer membrane beta-barrel protein [Burkholderiaceae bacterium]|nr:outer membrane beta-barrel protein [Burkholderiaceae bacterium]
MGARTMDLSWRRVAVAAALACGSVTAFAEGPQDRYWFGLEYFYPTISSTAHIDATATARPGTTINLEDELDLTDRKGTPYINLGMRLGENWRIEFEYYDLKRTANKTLTRDINWGDTTYLAGANIESKFDSTVYRLVGGWSWLRNQQAEAGLAFGLHVTDFKTQLSGTGTGILTGTSFQRESHDALVPLPTVGLYGSYLIAPQVILRGRVDFLSLKYQDYDGRLMNWMGGVDWRVTKNFGIGAGYRYVDYKLEATKSDFTGEVRYTFKGPTLYINGAF